MDIEFLIDEIIDALKDSEESKWLAAYYSWEASQIGRDDWAELVGQSVRIGKDQARNIAHAWDMYLVLLDQTKFADVIQEGLFVSHFYTAWRYVKTDTYLVCEALIQAYEEELSVRQLAALLETVLGEDPAGKFALRLGRTFKELKYIYGLSEFYKLPERIRKALKELIYELEHEA